MGSVKLKLAAKIKVTAPAESGRLCSKNCRRVRKTYENKRIYKGFKADAPDFKSCNRLRAGAGPVGRSARWGRRREGGGGGYGPRA